MYFQDDVISIHDIVDGLTNTSAPNCIKHFHWLIELFWPIRFDDTIVSIIGNSCKVKLDRQESPGKSRKFFIQLGASDKIIRQDKVYSKIEK